MYFAMALGSDHRPGLVVVRGVTVGLLLIGATAHLGWLLEIVVPTAVSPLHHPPGDLGAAGQPYGAVFRTVELLGGAAFVLAAPPLLRLAPVHWQGRLTVTAVCVAGILLLVHATFPPDCVAAAGRGCVPSGGVSVAHRLHDAASALLSLVYVAGPLTLALWWHGVWRAVVSIVVIVNALATLTVVSSELLGSGQFVGLAVRVQMLAATVVVGTGIAFLANVGRQLRGRWDGGGYDEEAGTCRD